MRPRNFFEWLTRATEHGTPLVSGVGPGECRFISVVAPELIRGQVHEFSVIVSVEDVYRMIDNLSSLRHVRQEDYPAAASLWKRQWVAVLRYKGARIQNMLVLGAEDCPPPDIRIPVEVDHVLGAGFDITEPHVMRYHEFRCQKFDLDKRVAWYNET